MNIKGLAKKAFGWMGGGNELRFGFEAEKLEIEPEFFGEEGFELESLRAEIVGGGELLGSANSAGRFDGGLDGAADLGRLVRAAVMEMLDRELITFARELRMNLR